MLKPFYVIIATTEKDELKFIEFKLKLIDANA